MHPLLSCACSIRGEQAATSTLGIISGMVCASRGHYLKCLSTWQQQGQLFSRQHACCTWKGSCLAAEACPLAFAVVLHLCLNPMFSTVFMWVAAMGFTTLLLLPAMLSIRRLVQGDALQQANIGSAITLMVGFHRVSALLQTAPPPDWAALEMVAYVWS